MIKTPRGKIQLINTHQAKSELSRLIREVEEEGALIRICRNGKPIVELRKINEAGSPLSVHPKLKNIVFHEDPSLPADNEDWPEEYR